MIHTNIPRNCVVFLLCCNGVQCQFTTTYKKNRAISRHVCVDYCILLLQHLSTLMHFTTNGYKRFSGTNSTDPRQRVPLRMVSVDKDDQYKLTKNHESLLTLALRTFSSKNCYGLVNTTSQLVAQATKKILTVVNNFFRKSVYFEYEHIRKIQL